MKRVLAVFVLAVALAGCPGEPPTQEELQAAYAAAVADAEIVEPGEISRRLSPIAAHNKNLVWEGEPGASRVLVVTWTSWTGYDGLVGKSVRMGDLAKASTETTRDIWVTAVPEIHRYFARNVGASQDPVLRAEQLLGLPPNNGKTRFVEFFVEPADLFRPSPDPEVTDFEAELEFPVSYYSAVSGEYAEWFNALKATSYGANGYPWTRLGYTYDWGSCFEHVGLSEYVIRPQATVEVHAVVLTESYLK